MIRPLILLAASTCLGLAQEFEVVVLELPNAKADPLVKRIREEKATPWKDLVDKDGTPLDAKAVKLVARLKVEREEERHASTSVKEELSETRVRDYVYGVSASKDDKPSTRNLSISLKAAGSEKAPRLESWMINLAAAPDREWSFSARHRKKDSSRIILERTSEPDEDLRKRPNWYAIRLLEGKSSAGKRPAKIEGKEFPANPDEFYRTEWVYPEGQWYLVQDDTVMPRSSVLDVDAASTSMGEGVRITFSARAAGIEGRIDFRRNFETKGKKTSYIEIGWPYDREDRGQEPPFTMQKVLEEQKLVFGGTNGGIVGDRTARKSNVIGEAIAD